MSFRLFISIFLFCLLPKTSLPAQVFDLPSHTGFKEKPVQMLELWKGLLLVTDRHIYFKKGKTFEVMWTAPVLIQDAQRIGSSLWLATADGLWLQSDAASAPKRTSLVKNAVLALAVGGSPDELLVGTADEGAMSLRDHTVLKAWIQNTRIDDVCAAGGYIWLGTDAGLLRVSPEDGRIQKYAEEGVAGFEIPDNIVERLFKADGEVLTIVMPKALAFFQLGNERAPADGEHFDYLGERDNRTLSVAQNKEGDFVFCTEKGVLLLDNHFLAQPHQHGGVQEVHDESSNPKVRLLQVSSAFPQVTGLPSNWDIAFFDRGGAMWLAAPGKAVRIAKKKVARQFGNKSNVH